MRLIEKLFAFVLGGFVLTACSGGYKEENNKMYYSYRPDWGPVSKQEVRGADLKSFKVLKPASGRKLYAVDRNHAYRQGRIIENADVATFEIINSYRNAAKDKNSYYYEGKKVSYGFMVEKNLIKE